MEGSQCMVMVSGRSRISPGRGHQHTNLPNVPKNCMKLKEFGPPGGTSKILLCRSATDDGVLITVT